MKKFFVIIFSLLISFAFAAKVSAMTVISPILELEGDAGKTSTGIVKIFNETDQPLTVVSSIEPFSSSDESGQPTYLLPEEKDVYLSWFHVGQESLTLKAREAAIVPFTVAIPENAAPGGYYAVIFWRTLPSEAANDQAVSITGKVGTLIFLKVHGDVRESGEIVEFSNSAKSDLVFSPPLNFIVRFGNIGNIHLAPSGEITLRNWLGNKVILPVNPDKKYVLPAGIRRFEVAWINQPPAANFFSDFWQQAVIEWQAGAIGRISASMRLSYGQEGQIIKNSVFWFFPWHLAVIIFGLLALLFAAFKINRRVNQLKRRKNNNSIPPNVPTVQ